MKKLFLSTVFSLSALFSFGQNCDSYFPMKEGAKLQYETQDKKEKAVSTVDYTVKKLQNTNEGQVATIEVSVKEGKKKVLDTHDFKAVCKDGVLSIDFESLMPSQFKESFKDFDYQMDGNNLEWPTDLKVGQSLPDGEMVMTVSVSGMNMEMGVELLNRKVEKKESITTPAGTFDCYLVSHDTKVKTMGTSINSSTKQWVAKGIGMIKTEEYRKGKLESTTLLTAYSK